LSGEGTLFVRTARDRHRSREKARHLRRAKSREKRRKSFAASKTYNKPVFLARHKTCLPSLI
jgi:hypothetical protein